jgi:hypothetical protein
VRRERGEPVEREGEELVLGAGAQIAHRAVDAATLPRDLHVADAGRAQLLLLVARASEHGVRVRVHEPRREQLPRAVHALGVGVLVLERGLRADGHDPSRLDEHRRADRQARVAHLRAAPRAGRAGAGGDLPRVDEEPLSSILPPQLHQRPAIGTTSPDRTAVARASS